MIWGLTPLQLMLLSLRIRERRVRNFVEQLDAARIAYASVYGKEADAAYRRLRADLLFQIEAPRQRRGQAQQLEFPLPAMFAGAPPEFFENIRIVQRKK